jgi:hypothetical protein
MTMKTTKQQRETRLNELVETHNIALSLGRLENSAPHDVERWKRALYHALTMQRCGNIEERRKIREALNLP